MILGYYIERHFNASRSRRGHRSLLEFIVGFYVTSFARIIRALLCLLENGISYDALVLVRSAYETYLHIAYAYHNNDYVRVLLARLGVSAGTHRFGLNRKGNPLRNQIVDNRSGATVIVPNLWVMASALGRDQQELYTKIYGTLSAHSHSEITNITHFLEGGSYEYMNQDFSMDVLVYSVLLTLMLMTALRADSSCPMYLKKDLLTGMTNSIFLLGMVCRFVEDHGAKLDETLEACLSRIAADDPLLARLHEAVRTG